MIRLEGRRIRNEILDTLRSEDDASPLPGNASGYLHLNRLLYPAHEAKGCRARCHVDHGASAAISVEITGGGRPNEHREGGRATHYLRRYGEVGGGPGLATSRDVAPRQHSVPLLATGYVEDPLFGHCALFAIGRSLRAVFSAGPTTPLFRFAYEAAAVGVAGA